jgi:hypothetical protein
MIEIVGSEYMDNKSSRASRTRLKSTTPIQPKLTEFKDWRGKITQPNLPEYEIDIFIFQINFCLVFELD